MENNLIRDITLAPSGEQKIAWVRDNMPLLNHLEKVFRKDKPFKGLKIALSVHLEAKTAYLCQVLAAGGAKMYVTGSNPLSTQDDVAAALADNGLHVFAWHNATPEEYQEHLRKVVECGPNIIIDDGGDLVNLLHSEYPHLIDNIIGGCEETTTGILHLEAMEQAKELKFPMVKVNDADCKHLFDNRYGTGQSVWSAICSTTNLIVAGKTVVVAGYGWCGKGVAMRAAGLGARVIITEINPVKALEARMDGFEVFPMTAAAPQGDIFITVTGCKDVITKEHFHLLKPGAILCNAGHFDCEINMVELAESASCITAARKNITAYSLPRNSHIPSDTIANSKAIFVLGEGRLVNLACGDGHPAEIMDMSFAIQALSAKYLAETRGKEFETNLISVPPEIDQFVAKLKLESLNVKIDKLTKEQESYLNSY